jgi:hypothetical protein
MGSSRATGTKVIANSCFVPSTGGPNTGIGGFLSGIYDSVSIDYDSQDVGPLLFRNTKEGKSTVLAGTPLPLVCIQSGNFKSFQIEEPYLKFFPHGTKEWRGFISIQGTRNGASGSQTLNAAIFGENAQLQWESKSINKGGNYAMPSGKGIHHLVARSNIQIPAAKLPPVEHMPPYLASHKCVYHSSIHVVTFGDFSADEALAHDCFGNLLRHNNGQTYYVADAYAQYIGFLLEMGTITPSVLAQYFKVRLLKGVDEFLQVWGGVSDYQAGLTLFITGHNAASTRKRKQYLQVEEYLLRQILMSRVEVPDSPIVEAMDEMLGAIGAVTQQPSTELVVRVGSVGGGGGSVGGASRKTS